MSGSYIGKRVKITKGHYSGKLGTVLKTTNYDPFVEGVWKIAIDDGPEEGLWGINNEAGNDPEIEILPKEPVDDKWYVRCTKEQDGMKVDSEYEVIADEGERYKGIMRYKVLIDDGEEWIHTENVTLKYQKHNTINNKNTDALQQIEAIKQQISDSQKQLEDSLKESVYKVGDWVIGKNDVYPLEPKYVERVEGNQCYYDKTNSCGMNFLRHCTEAEIQEATKIKAGDYIVIKDRKVVEVRSDGWLNLEGEYMKGDRSSGYNGHSSESKHIRKATPEEIKTANETKTLAIGSDKREVKVSKGKIVAAGNEVKIEDIDRILGIMKGTKGFGGWAVTFKEVKIGCCNSIQYSELKAIQEAYKTVNQ